MIYVLLVFIIIQLFVAIFYDISLRKRINRVDKEIKQLEGADSDTLFKKYSSDKCPEIDVMNLEFRVKRLKFFPRCPLCQVQELSDTPQNIQQSKE